MKIQKIFTFTELAEEYSISTRTLYNWTLPIRAKLLEMNYAQKSKIKVLIPKQVKLIREYLG